MRQQREFVDRSTGRVSDKLGCVRLAGPSSLRHVLNEISGESGAGIADFRPAHRMAPLNIPGDARFDRRSVEQCVHDVVIILDGKIVHLKGSLARREVYADAALRNCHAPKQPALGDPRIEIVNLHVLHGTCEDVKSYKRESTVMVLSIHSHVLADHEAHIGLKRKMRRYAPGCVRSLSADRRPPNEAVEIRNRGRFSTGSRQKQVKQRSAGTKQFKPAWNRLRVNARRAVASLIGRGSKTAEHWSRRDATEQASTGNSTNTQASLFQEASTIQKTLREMLVT